MLVQSGSPFSTPTAFWRTVSTIRSAGYAVTPYHVHVPTFGDWGFALARVGDAPPTPTVPANAPPLRYLNQQVLQAATVFSADIGPRPLDPSTLEIEPVLDRSVLDMHNQIALVIRGLLWAQPVPLEFALRTQIDLEEGGITVMELPR